MVLTAHMLQTNLGIHPTIADYFANQRAVPANNLFWEGKRIYLSAGFGFLTIPIVFDLQHRMGIPLEALLSDAHVTLMEQGFDKLKQYENKSLDMFSFLEECKLLLQDKIVQHHLATDLFNRLSGKKAVYFQFEEKHKALARSDMFLFTLVDLHITDEWVHQFLPIWYAAARPILLFDDFVDLEEDRQTGETENTIIELGNDKAAILQAYEMGKVDIQRLSAVNKQLSEFLQNKLDGCMQRRYIQEQLQG